MTTVDSNAASLSLFGRADVNPASPERSDSYLAGGRIRIGF